MCLKFTICSIKGYGVSGTEILSMLQFPSHKAKTKYTSGPKHATILILSSKEQSELKFSSQLT